MAITVSFAIRGTAVIEDDEIATITNNSGEAPTDDQLLTWLANEIGVAELAGLCEGLTNDGIEVTGRDDQEGAK